MRGVGVVGEQPVLNPGESFNYTSGTPLPTPSGIMHGSYGMESPTGERFEVEIPAFSLDSPHQSKTIELKPQPPPPPPGGEPLRNHP